MRTIVRAASFAIALMLLSNACVSSQPAQAARPPPQSSTSALGTPLPTVTAGPEQCAHLACVRDLGGPPPAFATALNATDDVVGQAGGHAFLWRDSIGKDLGTLPPEPDDQSESVAFALNNRGEIVGASGGFGPGPNDGLAFSGAFVYTDTIESMFEPQHSAGGWVEVFEGQEALGVNDSGTIVGVDRFRGFVFKGGVKWEVPPLSTRRVWNGTVAAGVNDAGIVVGATTVGPGGADVSPRVHAFAWRTAPTGGVTDLGTLPRYLDSIAIAVNGTGEIVGYAGNNDTEVDEDIADWSGGRDPDTLEFGNLSENGHAFLWKRGVMHDLGGTAAFAINDAGVIVGRSGKRAVVWHGADPLDLNDFIPEGWGWQLQCATGINDRGSIVGWGMRGGKRRAFLLRMR